MQIGDILVKSEAVKHIISANTLNNCGIYVMDPKEIEDILTFIDSYTYLSKNDIEQGLIKSRKYKRTYGTVNVTWADTVKFCFGTYIKSQTK